MEVVLWRLEVSFLSKILWFACFSTSVSLGGEGAQEDICPP